MDCDASEGQKKRQDKNRENTVKVNARQPAGTLTLTLVQSGDALAALTPEWDVLCARLPLQTPFVTAQWNVLWWQHLRATRLLIHDRLHSFVLRDANGALIAVAPMMISVRPGLGAFGIKVLQFFGADPNVTEVRGLICHPDDSDAALAVLQRHLLEHRHLWDWIEWQGLSPEQAVELSSHDIAQPKARVMCYLPLPADWKTLKGSLSRNMKEAIRKCANSLRRDRLEPVFSATSEPAEIGAALADFFRLHALRATSTEGVPHADAFLDKKSRAFLSAYATAMARQDKLRIFQLRLHGEVIATRIGFVLDGQLYLYYSGYHPDWGKYSVMTTLVIEAVQWAISHGCHCVNLSTGRDQSKLRWQPQEAMLHNAIQISPRSRSGLLFRTYSHLRNYPLLQHLSRKK